jgi:cell division protein FtsB
VRRSSWFLLACAIASIGVLFVFVFPTSSVLAQRRDRAQVAARLRDLTAQNRVLEARARRLVTPAEIERIAREKYDLVRQGEEKYVILPPQVPAPSVARPVDDGHGRSGDDGLWARVWSRVTSLL